MIRGARQGLLVARVWKTTITITIIFFHPPTVRGVLRPRRSVLFILRRERTRRAAAVGNNARVVVVVVVTRSP